MMTNIRRMIVVKKIFFLVNWSLLLGDDIKWLMTGMNMVAEDLKA